MPVMFSSRTVFQLALAFSASVDAYWRMNCGIVQTGRLDPVISFGSVSSHVHKIAGGSNINIDSDYDSMRNSSCTSCEIQADKSGYWTPQLYYEHADGSFEEVPNDGMVVYYLGRGVNRANIVPFPPGFKMMSGDALARSYDNVTMTWGNATNPPEKLAQRVSFNCLDEEGPLPQLPYMWRTNCSDGLRAQIQFQSCWDGVNLYKSDQSHVAYMSQIDNGACPPTHPVQFVHLFFEVLYGVNNVDQSDGGRFVFANGDPTGYGFHGDFMNGWDLSVLTPALANCANTDDAGQISACPYLTTSDINTYSEVCPQYAPSGIPVVNETVLGDVGNHLPGCIIITDGPAEANVSTIVCPPGYPVPPLNNLGPEQSPVIYTTPTPGQSVGNPGWQYVGLYNDTISTRVLNGGTLQNKSMSIELCQAYCSSLGERFAGVEYSNQCWCSSAIPLWANTVDSINLLPCAGNFSETCGGGGLLAIYNNTQSTATLAAPGAGPTPAAAGTYFGCAQEGSNGRVLSSASMSSTNMTLEMCRTYCDSMGFFYSGAEYSQQCYCGNSFANGGSMLSSNTSCSMLCGGDKAETCGGGNRLSVFNSTVVTMPTPPSIKPIVAEAGGATNGSWHYAACILDQGSPRALSGPSYTDGTAMTLERCAAFAQQLGQQYFAIEYASQCFTGNVISGPVAADTDCAMTCTGNKLEYCGGGWRLSTYVNLANGQQAPPLPSSTVVSSTSTTSTSTSSTVVSTTSTTSTTSTSTSSTSTSSLAPVSSSTKSSSSGSTISKVSTPAGLNSVQSSTATISAKTLPTSTSTKTPSTTTTLSKSSSTKSSTIKASSSTKQASAVKSSTAKVSSAARVAKTSSKSSSINIAGKAASSQKSSSALRVAGKVVSTYSKVVTSTTTTSVKTMYSKIKTDKAGALVTQSA